MKLAWCKNGFGEESDPLISKAPCSPSTIQVSEKTGLVLEGAHLLNLRGGDCLKECVCKSEALPLALTVVQTATSSSSPCGVPLLQPDISQGVQKLLDKEQCFLLSVFPLKVTPTVHFFF